MRYHLIFGALAAAFALSACSHDPDMDEGGLMRDSSFGNSVRQNIAVQTVNPDAPSTDEPVAASGSRAAIAQDRYDHDAVKPPSDPATASSGSSSSGASSGSGTSGGK